MITRDQAISEIAECFTEQFGLMDGICNMLAFDDKELQQVLDDIIQ